MCSKTEKDSYNQISYALHLYFHHHSSYSQHPFLSLKILNFSSGYWNFFPSFTVLSTLPNNPWYSRFWIVSPSLQIRVWNLQENCRSLPFLSRLDFLTMKSQLFCIVTAILMFKSNVSRLPPACHSNIMWLVK